MRSVVGTKLKRLSRTLIAEAQRWRVSGSGLSCETNKAKPV